MLKAAFARFLSLPIRIQLLTLSLFLMLPMPALVIHSELEQRNDAINAAMNVTRELADHIAAEKQQLVAGAEQLASALSQLPEVRHPAPVSLQPLLARILRLNSQYVNIAVSDRDGRYWVSALPMPTPFSVAERRYFRNARAAGRFSSGEYAIGKIVGRPTLGFAYPLLNAKREFIGSIVIILDLERFRQVPSEIHFPPGTTVTLIDHEGIILARSLENEKYMGTRISTDVFSKIAAMPDGSSFRSLGLDNVERFSFHRKILLKGETTPYLYIRAGIPVAAVLGPANHDLAVTMSISMTILIAGFALVWFVGKRSIVDRIRALEAASQQVAEGNLAVRVAETVSGGELGSLGRTFDAMAQRLAEREQEMNRAHEALMEKEQELLASRNMLQQWNHRLETAREQERHRLAREFHDVMGQALTALKLDMSWLARQLPADSPQTERRVKQMLELADSVIGMVRAIVAELTPPLLEVGLAEAIEWHAKGVEARSGISCLLMLDERSSLMLDKEQETVMFRIFQEAITNVVRHSEASEACISLCSTPSAVILEVADNGKGIPGERMTSPDAFGLLGMRERAQMCGAAFSITGASGGGTIVKVQISNEIPEGGFHEENPGH